MSEPIKALLGPQARDVCGDQKERTLFVEDELKRFSRRLERNRVAPVFSLVVYAFNCTNRDRHPGVPDPLHTDYVAGGSRHDIPTGLQATIRSLEHALAELKKKVQ